MATKASSSASSLAATNAVATFRKERSTGGFKLSVLKSGLQKAIRRGDVQLALQFAREFQSFKHAEGTHVDRRRIRTNFLHRLMVIFLEDVGQEYLWPQVEAYRRQAFATTWPSNKSVYRWTALMARAPKSRACSHARTVAQSGNSPVAAKHPLVLDFYSKVPNTTPLTTRLRECMSTPQAFVAAWQVSQLKEKIKTRYGTKPTWFIHEQFFHTCTTIEQRRMAELALAWNKELGNVKEGFLCWMLLLLSRAWGLPPSPIPSDDPGVIKKLPPLTAIPAYVVDMHVTGRKDYVRFAEEGSHVENEDLARVNPAFKAFYNDMKRVQAGLLPIGNDPATGKKRKAASLAQTRCMSPLVPMEAPLETSMFPGALRTQINTSQSKTDVYISTDPAGNVKVVKGPFRRSSSVTQAVALSKWKAENGLPSTDAELVWLVPDRWLDGVPLGVRNEVPRDKPAPFLVSTCLVPGNVEDIPAKDHASKLWPPTRVVDWAKLPQHYWKPAAADVTDAEKRDYVLSLLYRYVHGLGDLADRNFFRSGGRLVSIDEDCATRDVCLGQELKKTRAGLAKAWAAQFASEVISIVKNWTFDKDTVQCERWSAALSFACSERGCFDLFACEIKKSY